MAGRPIRTARQSNICINNDATECNTLEQKTKGVIRRTSNGLENVVGIGLPIVYPDGIPPARRPCFPRTIMNARFSSIAFVFFAAPAFAAERVDYVRDVKPIFAANCTVCHGRIKQKADLRLDLYANIKRGGQSGLAIVPQKAAESRLIQAVTGSNADVEKMPPKGNLSTAQVAILKQWINEGAKGPAKEEADSGVASNHWSFQPVKRPALPAVKNAAWPRNAIDRFVLARLEKEGIAPFARGGQSHADPPAIARPHRPAADAGTSERVLARTLRRKRMSGWSIACSIRRITANIRPGFGSTRPAMPIRTASPSMLRGRSGNIAIGSSTPSTAICRSTSSRFNSWPATCCRSRRPINSWRPAFIATR